MSPARSTKRGKGVVVSRINRPGCLCPNPQSTVNVRVCGKGELKVAHQMTS